MSKIIIFVLVGLAVIFGSPAAYEAFSERTARSKEVSTGEAYQPLKMEETDNLTSNSLLKLVDVKKIVTLESRNTVVFRGPVTSGSVTQVMIKLKKVSRKLNKRDIIYLVLDTPGGSVSAGLNLIDFMKALPQKITTITLFAASMGFQIVQNSDNRLITTNGTLMSHRAKGGVSGQFDGELESRYKMIKRSIDYLDTIASKRMGMSLKNYKSLIFNEYWVHGFDAVEDKAADEQILVRCGKSLDGEDTVALQTLFGTANLVFSKCPLVRAPISTTFNSNNPKNINYLRYISDVSFRNYRLFMKEFLFKPKFTKTFPSN